jgi:hypothetical protein
MYPLDDRSLIVALESTTLSTGRFCCPFAFLFDVAQRVVAVRLRFSCTEEVEIGAVDDEDVDAGHDCLDDDEIFGKSSDEVYLLRAYKGAGGCANLC